MDLPPPMKSNASMARRTAKRPSQNLLHLLIPGTLLEWKMIAAVSLVRFGLVPAASMAAVELCAKCGWLPADPVCMLAVLVQVRDLLVLLQHFSFAALFKNLLGCIAE